VAKSAVTVRFARTEDANWNAKLVLSGSVDAVRVLRPAPSDVRIRRNLAVPLCRKDPPTSVDPTLTTKMGTSGDIVDA
jgi:hypothetical protein